MVFVLALAGSLAKQQPCPVTAGTLPTHRFSSSACSRVLLIVVGLTYFPVAWVLAKVLQLMSSLT